MVDLLDPEHQWRRSTRCGTNACVEVAKVGKSYLVRDSKHPHGPVLEFDAAEWDAFAAAMTAGEFVFE